jgi:hypothetical protein
MIHRPRWCPRPRWLLLLLVFLAGGATGAVLLRPAPRVVILPAPPVSQPLPPGNEQVATPVPVPVTPTQPGTPQLLWCGGRYTIGGGTNFGACPGPRIVLARLGIESPGGDGPGAGADAGAGPGDAGNGDGNGNGGACKYMARQPVEFVNHPMAFPLPQTYRAFCRHITDGDTFDFLVDLGLNHYAYETVRLRGIDAPELSGTERPFGLQWKAFVESVLLDHPCRLRTYKDKETFGRYEADVEVWLDDRWWDLLLLLRAQFPESLPPP